MDDNFERLRNNSNEELETTLSFLESMVPCNARNYIIEVIKEILEKRNANVGVFIKTICGEEHLVKPTQAVSEIFVDGAQVYPTQPECFFNTPTSLADVKKMVEFLYGGKWRFSTNTDKTTYEELKDWANAPPENVAIVPWAFYGSYQHECRTTEQRLSLDNKRCSGTSVWIRSLDSKVKDDE